MEGPLQHVHVVKERHLYLLSQYIHLNPVKANLVNTPHDWIYSNFREWMGQRNGSLYSDTLLKRYFNNDPEEYCEAVKSYKEDYDDRGDVIFD